MIAAVLGALLAAAPVGDVAVSHRKVLAKDGTALALYRYAPPAAATERPPVLLVADFGLSRAAFDFHGDGLARWLARRGRLVYVAELRGQGKAAGGAWSPADVVDLDFPALAEAIGGAPFDAIVHGWAGTLFLAATTRELKGRVRKVVALGTPAEFAVPSRLAESLLASGGALSALGLDPESAKVFELLFAMGARIRPNQLAALRAQAFDDLGPKASSVLLKWMRDGDLGLPGGESVKTRLLAYDLPTLQLAGIADGWANAELCAPLREVTKAKVRLRIFSKFDLAAEDYSHLSLLQGRGARVDVFQPAFEFLQ